MREDEDEIENSNIPNTELEEGNDPAQLKAEDFLESEKALTEESSDVMVKGGIGSMKCGYVVGPTLSLEKDKSSCYPPASHIHFNMPLDSNVNKEFEKIPKIGLVKMAQWVLVKRSDDIYIGHVQHVYPVINQVKVKCLAQAYGVDMKDQSFEPIPGKYDVNQLLVCPVSPQQSIKTQTWSY